MRDQKLKVFLQDKADQFHEFLKVGSRFLSFAAKQVRLD